MTGDQFENPALDPVRPWADSPEAELELTHLISGTRNRVHERWGADLTRFLAELLESGTALVSDEADPVVNFVNANAAAFGFVPLIERHHETFSVMPAAQRPLRRALGRISRSQG